LLALSLALAVGLPASAAASSSATTISAVAMQQTSKTSGKKLTFTESLTSGVKVIGHDRVTCISNGSTSATCTALFTLARGTISVAGKVSFTAPSSTLRITGGTGAYKGKKGTLRLTPAGTRSLEVFTIR
jgi:lipopolysaccharide export system protein LptA